MFIRFLLSILIILFLSPPTFAAIDWYEDWEGETVDTEYADTPACPDGLYQANGSPTGNCSVYVRDDYTPRYGSQYLAIECDFVDCTDSEYDQSRRCDLIYGQSAGWSPCNEMKINDDTEYWWGISMYIPADYYVEYFSHLISQITIPDEGYQIIFALYYGGDAAHSREDYTTRHYYNNGTHYPTIDTDWADDKGAWVDWVFHAVWHDTDDSDAVFAIYKDGVEIYSQENVDNIPTGGEPVLSLPVLYNTFNYSGSYSCTGYTKAGAESTPLSPWRGTYWDEMRFTEDSLGTKGYCDVAPAIWAATPTITAPTNGSTGIATDPTITFSAYADHRSDPQDCFDAYKMKVEIDEDGGDWSTLVYDSGNVSIDTSVDASGLSTDTTYQLRVRHTSYCTERSTEFIGEWSSTVDFTTAEGPPSSQSSRFTGKYHKDGLNLINNKNGVNIK